MYLTGYSRIGYPADTEAQLPMPENKELSYRFIGWMKFGSNVDSFTTMLYSLCGKLRIGGMDAYTVKVIVYHFARLWWWTQGKFTKVESECYLKVQGIRRIVKTALYGVTIDWRFGQEWLLNCSGIKAYMNKRTWQVSGIPMETKLIFQKIKGTITLKKTTFYRLMSSMTGGFIGKFQVVSQLKQKWIANITDKGLIATPMNKFMKMIAKFKAPSLSFFKVEGDNAADIGHYFMKMTSKLNIAPLFQSISQTANEYLSAKKWFKYGDGDSEDDKEHRT